jgi:hypothetical protein
MLNVSTVGTSFPVQEHQLYVVSVTNSMDQSPSPEASSCSEILLSVVYTDVSSNRVHSIELILSVLSLIYPFYTLMSKSIKFILHLRLGLPNVLFLSGFPIKVCAHLPSTDACKFSAHYTLLLSIALWCLVKTQNYVCSHYVIFFLSCHILQLTLTYSLRNNVA